MKLLLLTSANLEGSSPSMTLRTELSGSFVGCKKLPFCSSFSFLVSLTKAEETMEKIFPTIIFLYIEMDL